MLTLLPLCTELKLSGTIVKVRKERSGYLLKELVVVKPKTKMVG